MGGARVYYGKEVWRSGHTHTFHRQWAYWATKFTKDKHAALRLIYFHSISHMHDESRSLSTTILSSFSFIFKGFNRKIHEREGSMLIQSIEVVR